jgi:hypothetical protein
MEIIYYWQNIIIIKIMEYGQTSYNRTVYAFLSCRTNRASRRLGVPAG